MRSLRRFLVRLLNFATRKSARTSACRKRSPNILRFQTEENLRAGMSPSEARRQAAIRLGGTEAIREHHHDEQSLPSLRICLRPALRGPHAAAISWILSHCDRHHGAGRRSNHCYL